jgi:hypothetical protein
MMSNKRNYSSAARAALWVLSRGTCFAPRCDTAAIRILDGLPFVNLEIAHIHAIEDNGPRAIKAMAVRERNAYPNLLLLCVPHHTQVDADEAAFPADMLLKWKVAKEKEMGPALATIGTLTQEMLQDVIKDAIGDVTADLDAAVRKLEQVAPNLARTVNLFVDTVGVATGAILDPDLVFSLSDASRSLRDLEDWAPMLMSAATKLGQMPEATNELVGALERFNQNAEALKEMSGY